MATSFSARERRSGRRTPHPRPHRSAAVVFPQAVAARRLTGAVSKPASQSIDALDRLRGLVEAGIALSSELSLEALLRKLIETAVELTGARFGALGVVDRS